MKLLIILLFSVNCFAGGWFPLGKEGVIQYGYKLHELHSQCEEAENHPCYDIDKCNPNECELKDEYRNGTPIYSAKENITFCETEETCKELESSLCLEPYKFYYAEKIDVNAFEAYCTKIVGYEQVKTGKKILVESPVKKAAYLAKQEAKKQAEENKKLDKLSKITQLKTTDFSKITQKQLEEAVKKLIELVGE